jgi:hypothetical protein
VKSKRLITNGNSKTKNGTLSELKVIAWLYEQGYEVFNNVSAHGNFDVVIYDKKAKEFRGYDVKTANFWNRRDGEVTIHHATNKTGVDYILVLPDGTFMFKNNAL